MKDYYKILDIDYDATESEIKKAYRKKCRELHPDLHAKKSEEFKRRCEEKLKEVNEAYDVLYDFEKKTEYDKKLREYLEQQEEKKRQEAKKRQERKKEQTKTKYKTNREKSNQKSKEKVAHSSFFKDFVTSYREIKQEEEQNSFAERHTNFNHNFYKEYRKKANTPIKSIIFYTSLGVLHVSLEAIHQLKGLKFITEDSVVKYAIRNRALASIIALTIIFPNIYSSIVNEDNNSKTTIIKDEPSIVHTDTEIYRTESHTSYENERNFLLTRLYEVKEGDTLSGISDKTSVELGELRKANDITSDMIYIGTKIVVPYTVDVDDLQYYTRAIDNNNISIEDLAAMYDTDIYTIKRLNKEALLQVDDTYVIISDKVLVPVFKTKEAVRREKEAKVKKVKTYY